MRRPFGLLAVFAACAAAHAAEPPAPAPQPPAPAAARLPAAPLGRFFFSPNERSQLDVARLQKRAPTAAVEAEKPEAPPMPEVVTYGGLVRRSDGRQMLWLNNRLVDAKEGIAGMSIKGKVRPDGAVTLQSASGATVEVKVGQSVELYTGRVAETRKPPPEEAKAPPEEGRTSEAKEGESKPPAVAAKPPPAPTEGEKKPQPPGGVGLKMDLGGRALSSEEAARLSSK